MSNDTTYNGWSNRETWLIVVWYAPQSRNDIEYAKQDFEDRLNRDSMLRDFINFEVIDWQELIDYVTDDSGEEDDDNE